MVIECRKVWKEDNSLIFRGSGYEYRYDLKTKDIVDNHTGEVIEDLTFNYVNCSTFYEDFLCKAFTQRNFAKLDSLLSYYVVAMRSIDNDGREHRCLCFGDSGYDYDYGLMPKGFVKFVEKFDDVSPAIALRAFDAFNTLPPKESSLFKQIISSMGDSSAFTDIVEDGACLKCFKALSPCIKNTSRTFNRVFDIYDDALSFLRLFKEVNYNEKYLDVTKDLTNNVTLLKAARDKERGVKVIAQEAKILPIESLSDEDFVVVVPKKPEDFTDEGRQQHNCVGYYYHDSIVDGKNLIYFLRKKDNPTHSFVTCRFYIDREETVEYRMFDNAEVDRWSDEGRAIIRFIGRIDMKIREILG